MGLRVDSALMSRRVHNSIHLYSCNYPWKMFWLLLFLWSFNNIKSFFNAHKSIFQRWNPLLWYLNVSFLLQLSIILSCRSLIWSTKHIIIMNRILIFVKFHLLIWNQPLGRFLFLGCWHFLMSYALLWFILGAICLNSLIFSLFSKMIVTNSL